MLTVTLAIAAVIVLLFSPPAHAIDDMDPADPSAQESYENDSGWDVPQIIIDAIINSSPITQEEQDAWDAYRDATQGDGYTEDRKYCCES